MDKFITKTKVKKDHLIEIENVPFDEGEEVIITVKAKEEKKESKYPLWGSTYKYIDPFEPVVV
jgi:hypothetical protein